MARGKDGEERQRGLPSLNEARAERRRAIVGGKVRVPGMSLHFWIWTAVILAGFGVVYWKIQQGKLESQKAAVMAKQRAIAKTLGPRILPFRDRIEGWVEALAGPWNGDHVEADVPLSKIRRGAGVYLRLRMDNAKSADSIRKSARRSLHDGFTSCFFIREHAVDPAKGPKCRSMSDCPTGLLCNEYDACSPPPDPFNMRLAYRALRVLSTDWTDELHGADSDLAVTAYDRDLDRVTHDDVPIAIAILSRARYFTAVLDEDPAQGLPKALGDAGDESDEQRVQRVGHAARVGIWELASGRQLVRLRGEASGRFVPVGDAVVQGAAIEAAQQRQVNSCALALEVRGTVDQVQASQARQASDAGAASDAGTQAASDAGTQAASDAGTAAPDAGAAPAH